MSAEGETELPDVGEILGALLGRVQSDRQPLLLAIAERMAAERYRAWAAHDAVAMHRSALLACAEREEEIATRVEALHAGAAEIEDGLRAAYPDLADINRDLFAGRALAAQFTLQARGERLGALTWRALAERAADLQSRDSLSRCAELEETSAAVLEDILAMAVGSALEARRPSLAELEAGLDEVRLSPRDGGALRLIVCRPRRNQREVLSSAQLDTAEGLVGDNWKARGSRATADGSAHPEMQLNIMNARAAALVAQDPGRWALAGDQLFLDFDLSGANLPPATRLALGDAVIEVTDQPHTGCKKFVSRFGAEAMKFVNSPLGRELNLRGINAKVVRGGTIRVGDLARKI